LPTSELRVAKQSFASYCVPNSEIGNEESGTCRVDPEAADTAASTTVRLSSLMPYSMGKHDDANARDGHEDSQDQI